jgi:hypothetical protein
LDAGAVHKTVAWALPAVAVTAVGALGTVLGVTLFEGAEAAPLPIAFAAVTVKVYAVPLVKPPTVAVLAPPATVMLPPAGFEVIV